ncbi:MAG TPA: hypothetical protein VJV79_02030 [Polyangiaceae bacterium]|nr:hypothetical protein [Polyangiaceae bacterium]
MGTKLKLLIEEYGPVAAGTYFTIFLLTLAGFALAIHYGWRTQGTGENAGLLMAAWVATKLTQPLRIAASLALTPIVAKALQRFRGTPKSDADAAP